MRLSRHIIFLLLALPCLAQPSIGLTGVPRYYRETEAGWMEVFRKAQAGQVSLLGVSAEWNDVTEPKPGVYNWKSLDVYFATLKKSRLKVKVSLDLSGPFWHNEIKKPSHVEARFLNQAEFRERYRQMLVSLLRRHGKELSYLTLNAEGATTYFRHHPGHFEDYLRFLKEVRALVRRLAPGVKFGVNTDPVNSDRVLTALASGVDYLAFDVTSVEGVERPSDLSELCRRLVEVVGPKRIAFQNAWWSSSKVEGSSEAQQAEFIRQLFKVTTAYEDRLEYVIVYTLFDEDIDFMRPLYAAQFPNLPPAYREKMLQSNGRSGLFHHDLKPKPAWMEFKRQMAALKLSE